MRQEISAGGIVYKKGEGGLRIAFILDPFRKWTFAKGHLEAGETPEQAAIREVGEEIGLKRLKIIAPLGTMNFWFKDRWQHKGDLVHKTVYYFLMRAPRNAKARPQKAEKIRKARWVPLKEAVAFSGYKNILGVLKKALQILGEPVTGSKKPSAKNHHLKISKNNKKSRGSN